MADLRLEYIVISQIVFGGNTNHELLSSSTLWYLWFELCDSSSITLGLKLKSFLP
jgi:hypothetical protein